MAIKKSDLYSSIWASCDELRGGKNAFQYVVSKSDFDALVEIKDMMRVLS